MQLADADAVDPQVATRLRTTIADIEATLEGAPLQHADHPSFTERLSEAARAFEASHPTLVGTIHSAIDGLARMGI